jgi:tRNA pseudouridine55 synthase
MKSINIEGDVILIDKPLNITSFGVVKRLKHSFVQKTKKKRYKIGHAGTLDPLASGLMILCNGKFTKKISMFQDLQKEYTGVITLGATTPSFDLETEVDQTFITETITEQQILDTALTFIGENNQVPPIFSAKKINGKRAYNYAREGEEVVMKPNLVTIHEFEVTKIDMPNIHFRIACSKGTYIRSIAFDFGKRLNNGGHLTVLRRTKIGDYSVENAYTIDDMKEIIDNTEYTPTLH